MKIMILVYDSDNEQHGITITQTANGYMVDADGNEWGECRSMDDAEAEVNWIIDLYDLERR